MDPDKFDQLEARFVELENLLADQDVIADQNQYQKLAKEYSDITPTVTVYREYQDVSRQIADTEKLLTEKHDAEFEELAKAELAEQTAEKSRLEQQLADLTNPRKQEQNRDLILEIRAGTGGEEASLFAADLYRMYTKYCDKKGWRLIPSVPIRPRPAASRKLFSVSVAWAPRNI